MARTAKISRGVIALLPTVLAFALQWLLWPWIRPNVWCMFYPAVFLSAWLGGLWVGLIATALSIVLALLLFEPMEPMAAALGSELFPAVMLAAIGVFVAVFLGHVRRSHYRLLQAERDLHDATADLGRAQEVADVGSWRVYPDQRRVWSAQTYRMFGVPPGTPVSHEMFMAHVHPDDRERIEARWQAAMRGQPLDHELRIIVDGRTRWVRAKAEVDVDAKGAFRGSIGIVQDITALKQLEVDEAFLAEAGAVLSSTLEYEQTLTNIAELAVRDLADFCVVDIVDEQGHVRRLQVACHDPANHWVCEILGRSPLRQDRPIMTATALQSRHTEILTDFTPEMLEQFAHSKDHLAALRGMDPGSGVFVPLIARGALLGAIGLIAQRTSRPLGPSEVRLAEELARRAALSIDNARLYLSARHASDSRDDVLAIVAHDLRNPLGTLMLHVGLLRDQIAPEHERSLASIEKSARRMNRLIQDLLDISRLESGRLPLSRERLPAAMLLAEALDAQKPLAAAAGIQLVLEAEHDLPDLWADHDRIAQMFENLIGNAVKFTPTGGRITVRASTRDGEVQFEVADTGQGIAPEDQAHVFDRFWQGRKSRREGAGLGLPIVKGLVETHAGHIWLVSQPGTGTTVFFTIPTSPACEHWEPAAAHGA
jgi:PAS domain S-box-containing protein